MATLTLRVPRTSPCFPSRRLEIYFSIVHRKALTPNDFSSLTEVEERLLHFQDYYESIATPFEWKFTRDDLAQLLKKTPMPGQPRCALPRSVIRCRTYQSEY